MESWDLSLPRSTEDYIKVIVEIAADKVKVSIGGSRGNRIDEHRPNSGRKTADDRRETKEIM